MTLWEYSKFQHFVSIESPLNVPDWMERPQNFNERPSFWKRDECSMHFPKFHLHLHFHGWIFLGCRVLENNQSIKIRSSGRQVSCHEIGSSESELPPSSAFKGGSWPHKFGNQNLFSWSLVIRIFRYLYKSKLVLCSSTHTQWGSSKTE